MVMDYQTNKVRSKQATKALQATSSYLAPINNIQLECLSRYHKIMVEMYSVHIHIKQYTFFVPQNLPSHFTQHMPIEILNLLKVAQELTRQTLS